MRGPSGAELRGAWRWAPALVLAIGVAAAWGGRPQRRMPLAASLADVLPREVADYVGRDGSLGDAAVAQSGATEHLMRFYAAASGRDSSGFSLYVGYYEQQTRGKTIHSPKNCLPGSGWEPLASRPATVATTAGPVVVNRYLLQRNGRQVLVLYWYQGRGRVQASEYAVKWDLLRDAALRGRSDEALVRLIVPVRTSEAEAFALAARAAGDLIPQLHRVLPS